MSDKIIRLIILCLLFIFGSIALYGCAGTMQAIEHRQMSMSAKMSDTIFLDPETLAKNRSVYVRVTNTSDFQEIDFGELLKAKLSSKGLSRKATSFSECLHVIWSHQQFYFRLS